MPSIKLWDGESPAALKRVCVSPPSEETSLEPRILETIGWSPASLCREGDQLLSIRQAAEYLDPFQSEFKPRCGLETVLVILLDDLG